MPVNGHSMPVPVIDQLRQLVDLMEHGPCPDYNMVTIITQNSDTGHVSITSLTPYGNDGDHLLFDSMARCLGYGKVQ